MCCSCCAKDQHDIAQMRALSTFFCIHELTGASDWSQWLMAEKDKVDSLKLKFIHHHSVISNGKEFGNTFFTLNLCKEGFLYNCTSIIFIKYLWFIYTKTQSIHGKCFLCLNLNYKHLANNNASFIYHRWRIEGPSLGTGSHSWDFVFSEIFIFFAPILTEVLSWKWAFVFLAHNICCAWHW